jgi:hypothetical protein
VIEDHASFADKRRNIQNERDATVAQNRSTGIEGDPLETLVEGLDYDFFRATDGVDVS